MTYILHGLSKIEEYSYTYLNYVILFVKLVIHIYLYKNVSLGGATNFVPEHRGGAMNFVPRSRGGVTNFVLGIFKILRTPPNYKLWTLPYNKYIYLP